MTLKKNHNAIAAAVESLESRTLMSADWYVSNGGDDAAFGAQSSPVATLQAALNRAQSGDRILLSNGTYDGNVRIDTPNLTIRSVPGQMASIASPNDDASAEVTIRIGENAHGTKLKNLDISGGYYYAIKTESTWDSGAADPHGPSNVVIVGNRIHDSGADVIKLTPGTNYSEIINNEIFNSGRTSPDNAEGIDAVQANFAVVRGNSVHDTTTNGIYYKGGSRNTLIENNWVSNTAHSGILLGQSSDENWFDNAFNPGYFESIDAVVRNNVVWNTEGAGIGAWAALRPTIYNNTLNDVAKSMFGGLLIQGQEHWLPSGGDFVSAVIPSQDVTMFNNIVSVTSDRPVFEVREGGLVGSLNLSNNMYYQNGGPVVIRDAVSGYEGGLVGWQRRRGHDYASLNANPQVNAGADFSLMGNSPAINRGAATDLASDFDYRSRPLYGAVDIGAHEFAG